MLRFGNKLNEEVCRGFIFANLFNSLYLLVRLWWNVVVANLATNFQDLVAKVKNLVTLAPVLGAISHPGANCNEAIHLTMTLPLTLFHQNSAPDLDYRFSETEITLSWFPSHSFKLFLIDGLLNRLLSFCLYHLDSSFLVLLTIILTAPLGVWHRFDLLFAMEVHCVIWPWNVSASNKVAALHIQICWRRLWVSRGSHSGYSAAKLFSVNCTYFMNVTRKWQ